MDNRVCGACNNQYSDIWARLWDGGKNILVCRFCWEAKYPCEITSNFVQIPYRMKCVFGWSLTSPTRSLTVQPGDFEVGVINDLLDVATLWVYSDEIRPTDRNVEPYINNIKMNDIRQELLTSCCSCEDGLQPVLVLYSFLKEYGIFYHKDNHIAKHSF